ncbi:MAG: hypothetical protein ABIH22_02380 [Candidatus Margulisiibacteriota bacterium]
MMYGGMIFGSLLMVASLLGFAFIIWVLAVKEKGNVKMVGQVIAIVIAVMAAIILLYGTIYGGMMGRGAWCDKGADYYKDMGPGSDMHERMEKWMDKYKK